MLLTERPLDIIVAEDESITRLRLVTTLEKMGHRVRHFGDGMEAWQAFETEPAQVIISDWQMPSMDGPELCQRVRAAQLPDYTYFILITSVKTAESDFQIASDAGTDDFLTKPLTLDNLWRRLRVARRILDFSSEVDQLKDLIPICAYCRQVREDGDYWSNLEHYVQAHTKSRFSHGICPQCYAKVMHDFEKEKEASEAAKRRPAWSRAPTP